MKETPNNQRTDSPELPAPESPRDISAPENHPQLIETPGPLQKVLRTIGRDAPYIILIILMLGAMLLMSRENIAFQQRCNDAVHDIYERMPPDLSMPDFSDIMPFKPREVTHASPS